jgi:ferritin-like metal-binding protein YciE
MEGLLEEGKEVLKEEGETEVIDAGIIAAAQRVEHYQIAAYGAIIAMARQMEHTKVVELLEQSLEEEKEADATLTAIAASKMSRMPAGNGDER